MDAAIAPELPHTLEWLNLGAPLRLAGLRGRACLLAFVNQLWIADAGNDALRTLRLGGGELSTWRLPRRLHHPGAIAVAAGVVWIADTDAHAVLRLDTRSGALQHLPVGE